MLLTQSDVRALIRDLFEEEALALGGLVAVHEMEDDLVWRLVRTLDVVRTKISRRLEDRGAVGNDKGIRTRVKPHPAIEDFLLKLRRT